MKKYTSPTLSVVYLQAECPMLTGSITDADGLNNFFNNNGIGNEAEEVDDTPQGGMFD